MATFNYLVSKYTKENGTRNVMIYVFHNRKKRYPPTNIFLAKDDLTKSGKIKNQIYIDLLEDILRKCRRKCNEFATNIGGMGIEKVVLLVAGIITGKETENSNFDLDFVNYGRNFAKQLQRTGHTGNAKTYTVALNNLVKFVGRENISIHEITKSFVQKWIEWIQSNSKGGRAESLYPANIRALHNAAKLNLTMKKRG